MASPVDTSVKHYRSDISTSLVLNGQAGSLIGLLDATLVNGYGLQTASSLTVTDGVATVTFPSAFAATEDLVVLVAGATPAALNGEQRLISVATATNSIQFATETANTTATGTITVKIAPAGWTKVFSGTNKAVYRSPDPQAHAGGMCIRVDDTGTLTARVVGYETMRDVDTGTGPFPTNAQQAGGLYWHKSSAANANAVLWSVIADSRFFMFYATPQRASSATTTVGVTRGFGDLIPLRPTGDPYAVLIAGSATSVGSISGLDESTVVATYVARAHTGLGSSVAHAKPPYVGTGQSGSDTTMGPFPNPITGKLYLSKKYVSVNANQSARAEIPGFLHAPHTNVADAFSLFDKILGSDDLFGRTILGLTSASALNVNTPSSASFVDITGPWR